MTRVRELADSDRAMLVVRMAGCGFALLQVVITPDQPGWVKPLAYLWTAGLFACGILLRAGAVRGSGNERSLAGFARLGLLVDSFVVQAFVLLYAFDPHNTLWALLFILALEGAIRFGLAGALGAMTFNAVLYTGREYWALQAYGYPISLDGLTYQLGIGFIIALVAGLMARNLRREREQVMAAYLRLKELDVLKDGFLTAASHELRTPLTIINGFAHTLRKNLALPESSRADYLDAILKHGDRLNRLAGDIIDITRVGRGALPLNLDVVAVRDVVSHTVDISEMDVTVSVPDGLHVRADPARVEQILHNLLENARKYGRPPFALSVRAEGDTVQFFVADHGDGVPEADRELIFELFCRRQVGEPGSGVGLTFSAQLAEAMGGRLTYEPVPYGACFRLGLPAVPGSQAMVTSSRELGGP